MHFDQFGHVAEVSDDGHLHAIGAKGEANGIGGVVRNRKRMDVNIANREVLAGVNRFDAAQPFFKPVRKNALQRVKCGLCDIERCFPETKHLRKPVAVIRVLVSDENSVQLIEGDFGGGKTGERLAFAKTAVHKEAGTRRFEQRDVARTAGRQNGNAQAYRSFSKICRALVGSISHKTNF